MARLFLSYASSDRELTARIATFLEAAGHEVWWDTDLVGGDSFRSVIDEQLNAADAVIVVWTPASVRSSWVIAETDHAMRLGRLLPLRSESIQEWQIPKPFGILHTQTVDDQSSILRAVEHIVNREDQKAVRVESLAAQAIDAGARNSEVSAEVQINTYLVFLGLLLLLLTGLAVLWKDDNRMDKAMLVLAGSAIATIVIVAMCFRLCRATRNPVYHAILTSTVSNIGIYAWLVAGTLAAYASRSLDFKWTLTAGVGAMSTWAALLAFQLRGAAWVLPAARFLSMVQVGWLAVHLCIQFNRGNYRVWFHASSYAFLHLLYVATGFSAAMIAVTFLIVSFGYAAHTVQARA